MRKARTKSPFREILEATRQPAAERAWERAQQASSLRHLMQHRGNPRATESCSQIKIEAIRLAKSLAPEQITVTIDDDYHVGLISVRWKGHGRCHLPIDADIDPQEDEDAATRAS